MARARKPAAAKAPAATPSIAWRSALVEIQRNAAEIVPRHVTPGEYDELVRRFGPDKVRIIETQEAT